MKKISASGASVLRESSADSARMADSDVSARTVGPGGRASVTEVSGVPVLPGHPLVRLALPTVSLLP